MKSTILYSLMTIYCLASSLTSRSGQGFAQTDVTFLSNLDQYSSAGYNDIWGYVDGSGNEYALLGVQTGTSIINVTDPVNPGDSWFNQSHNIFIDYGFAFVIGTRGGGGIAILDLTEPVNPVETAYY